MKGEKKVKMVYETSTIGICLTEALGELLDQESISPDLAFKVLEQLDKVGLRDIVEKYPRR